MPKKDPQTCQNIRDRIDKWEKYWTINRSLYYEWIDFVMGDQWREDESKLFERYNKIPMVFNKLGVLMNHLLGDQMQNTPNLQILPEENVDAETANVREALVKHITLNSDAKTVYQHAFWQSIVGGYGVYIIGLDYINDFSMDQEIKFLSIDDPNRAYWDISATHVCKVDGMFAGYKTRVSRVRFRDKYGRDVESQIGTTATTEDSTIAFADDDSITIVDDFERTPHKVKIYKLSDGSVIDEEEIKSLEKMVIDGKKYLLKDGRPVTIVKKRETIHYTITHRKIAGDYILEESDFPSEKLPVIFVDQKSYFTKQGQQITRSFFKDVKDAQKYLNYLATQSCYIMKISRYDQFIAPRQAIASPDTQQQFRDPSVVRGAIFYDETPSGGKPEKLNPPELSQSLLTQYERCLVDIQTGTGMYNAQIGEVGNEVSGSAIDARTQRGVKNTYVPYNSLNIAIATGGEIINEMIPKVYSTERQIMISMPESESKSIILNQAMDPYGTYIKNDMTKGRYRIKLKPGPSYEGQKVEALQSLQTVLAADKSGSIFPMIADMYVENLPLDNNVELKNRLRTLVPQEIIKAGKSGEPLPPKPKQPSKDEMLMQLKQQELQLKANAIEKEYEYKLQQIALKQSELQRKAIESHQDISMEWEKLEAEKEMAAANLQSTILKFEAEMQRLGADIKISDSNNLVKLLTTNARKQNYEHEKPRFPIGTE
jgi:Phage P22-like portal protein